MNWHLTEWSFSSRYLVLGDFNGHSYLWGANQENERGKVVKKLIDSHNLILLNDFVHTRFDSYHQTNSLLSMSVLQAIESQESKNPLVNRVVQACQKILSNGKFITFCWLPSHRDIRGNEDADRAAKDALLKAQPQNFELPCTDVFMKIQPFISSLWQKRWDKEVANKLHAIMPQIDDKYYSGCKNRKDEVIINRLRIGHTRLTHSFRMENRPNPPLCDQCEGDHELTVKHILIECNFLKIIRRRHYDVTDLNQLFKTVSSKRILDFIKDIGLYNSL